MAQASRDLILVGAICATILSAAVAVELPLLNPPSDKSQWIQITSEQSTLFTPKLHNIEPSSWIVEDYFSLELWSSVSIHTNKRTNDNFILLSDNGKIYLITPRTGEDNAIHCQLDHRHDHSTLYPWRYSNSPHVQAVDSAGILGTRSETILGIGALWLNLARDKQKSWCQVHERDHLLSCYTPRSKPFGGPPDERASLLLELHFEWPLAYERAQLNAPLRASVRRKHALHHDQATLMEQIEVSAKITEAKYVDSKARDKFRYYLDFCKRSVQRGESLFPSLMRQIGSSERRVYSFRYTANTFQYGGNGEQKASALQVQEMFSYVLESQAILLTNESSGADRGGSKFLRIFGVIPDRTVSYEIQLNQQQEPVECKFAPIDSQQFIAVSPLMRRHLLLSLRPGDREDERASGELVGLGALLMNVADIRNKRKVAKGDASPGEISMQNRWFSYVEWTVEDFERERRFHFYFKRNVIFDEPLSDIGDLVRVELFEKYSFAEEGAERKEMVAGGLDEDKLEDDELFNWRLVMELEQIEFSSRLYSDEIESAFRVPRLICPQAQDVQLDNLNSTTMAANLLPNQSDDELGEKGEEDSKLNIPSYYNSQLATEWNYKVGSRWTRFDKVGARMSSLKLLEWFTYAPAQNGLRAQLARLDVEKEAEVRVTYHLRYEEGIVLKEAPATKCTLERPESWLEVLSTPMDFPSSGLLERPQLPQYGVAALWRLGSQQSELVMPKGEHPLDPKSRGAFAGATHYGTWMLLNSENSTTVPMLYNFTYKRSSSTVEQGLIYEPEMVGLHSISLHTRDWRAFDGANVVVVDEIYVESPIRSGMDAFALPAACESLLMEKRQDLLLSMPKFPSFHETFKRFPKEAEFQLNYGLHISRKSTQEFYDFQVREVNNPAHKLGQMKLWTAKEIGELEFWTDYSSDKQRVELVELKSTGACGRAPDMGELFELHKGNTTSEMLDNQRPMFLLAGLWQLYAGEAAKVVPSARVDYRDGNKLHLYEWTLVSPGASSTTSFEFIQSDVNDQNSLKLNAVTLDGDRLDALELRFMVSYAGPILLEGEAINQLPYKCANVAHSFGEFPKLTSLLGVNDELFHLRSELSLGRDVPSSLFVPKRVYRLDEWLQFNSVDGHEKSADYRVVIKSASGNNVSHDFLLYESFKELFEFHAGSCKCHHLQTGSTNASSDSSEDWILAQLMRVLAAEESELTYLPVSLWLFASTHGADSNVHRHEQLKLTLNDLTEQQQMSRWLELKIWRIELKRWNLVLEMQFKSVQDVGRHSQQLERMEIYTLGEAANRSKLLVDIFDYRFIRRKSHNPSEKLFLIPKGLGCKRSKRAKDFYAINDTKDVIVFERLSPVEFHYKSSLSLAADYAALEPLPEVVILSGWSGRCPSRWNLMRVGRLQVDLQHRHHMDGRLEIKRRLTEDMVERTIDEFSGKCSIQRLGSHKIGRKAEFDELLSLNFGGLQDEIVLAAKLLSPDDEERIQSVEETYGDEFLKTVVYESVSQSIALSPRLRGPGKIVKTFRRRRDMGEDGAVPSGTFYYHSSVRLEVIISGRAHLIVDLDDIRFRECLEILREAHIGDCYAHHESATSAQRKRHFELGFELVDDKKQQVDLLGLHNTFESDKVLLERDLERALLHQFVAIPALQLANTPQLKLRLSNLNEDKPEIFAEIQLLEPVQLVHAFERLDDHRVLPSRDLTDSIELTNSVYACSNLCESSRGKSCIAFSYCNDRSCHIIQKPKGMANSDLGTLEILQPRLEQNPGCRLYYAPKTHGERLTIDEMADSIRSTIESDASKISLEYPWNGSEQVHLIATELHEIFQNPIVLSSTNVVSKQESARKSTSYAILVPGSRLDLTKWIEASYQSDVGEADSSGRRLATAILSASTEGRCLQLCDDIHCWLGSYCSKTQTCSLVGNLSRWKHLKKLLNQAEHNQADCSVFSKNFLADYELFEPTREPKSAKVALVNFSAQRCAAACAMEDAIEDGKDFADCLSFDYCFDESIKQPVCYLSQMHRIMDDFDETILAHEIQTGSAHKRAKACQHYSRSLVADFRLVARRKKFAQFHSVIFKSIELEMCALICKRAEICLAFEYCAGSSSCYIERSNASAIAANGFKLIDGNASEECNIYRLRHSEDHSALLQEQFPSGVPKVFERLPSRAKDVVELSVARLLYISLAALTIGAAASSVLAKLIDIRLYR